MLWVYICSAICALFVKPIQSEDVLVFSNVMWRHGARSPMIEYDVNPNYVWPQGTGQLTQIGMRMQYELGQFLRKRYDGILNDMYKRVEITVRSSDIDRTLMSAEANMAGIFRPSGSQKWNKTDTNWQPIPIHTVPVSNDPLIALSCITSVGYKKILEDIKSAQNYKTLQKKYATFFESLKSASHFNRTLNLSSSWDIQDSIACEKAQNVPMPDWVTPHVTKVLDEIVGLDMGIRFGGVGGVDRIKLAKYTGGYIVEEYIKNLNEFVNGTTSYKVKAYSGHDTTLSALLMALNVYNWKQPPFASAVLIELYKDSADSYFVKGFFRNSTGSLIPLKMLGCEYKCPLKHFIQLSQNLLPNEQDRASCLNALPSGNEMDSKLVIIYALFSVLLFTWFVMVIVVCKTIYNKKKSSVQYEPVGNNADFDTI